VTAAVKPDTAEEAAPAGPWMYLVQVVFERPLAHWEYAKVIEALNGAWPPMLCLNLTTDPLDPYLHTAPRGYLAVQLRANDPEHAERELLAATYGWAVSRVRSTRVYVGETPR
jgi:hypothetical protein